MHLSNYNINFSYWKLVQRVQKLFNLNKSLILRNISFLNQFASTYVKVVSSYVPST